MAWWVILNSPDLYYIIFSNHRTPPVYESWLSLKRNKGLISSGECTSVEVEINLSSNCPSERNAKSVPIVSKSKKLREKVNRKRRCFDTPSISVECSVGCGQGGEGGGDIVEAGNFTEFHDENYLRQNLLSNGNPQHASTSFARPLMQRTQSHGSPGKAA